MVQRRQRHLSPLPAARFDDRRHAACPKTGSPNAAQVSPKANTESVLFVEICMGGSLDSSPDRTKRRQARRIVAINAMVPAMATKASTSRVPDNGMSG